MSAPTLFFKSINPEANGTLLLLHGAVSSHHEWQLVSQSPHLKCFHLLIPDLPAHGQSISASIPFTIPDTAALLADLVTKHAKNGRAGIAGMSLGGYIAIYMVSRYPDIVGDHGVFLTGCGQSWPRPGTWGIWAYGVFIFLRNWVLTGLPKGASEWVFKQAGMDMNDGLYSDMIAASTYQFSQTVMEALAIIGSSAGEVDGWKVASESVGVRACIIAGVLEDSEKDCRERGQQLRKGNPESKAFKVEGKGHAWDLQDPELFALGIKAWMDHEPMPTGYDELLPSSEDSRP